MSETSCIIWDTMSETRCFIHLHHERPINQAIAGNLNDITCSICWDHAWTSQKNGCDLMYSRMFNSSKKYTLQFNAKLHVSFQSLTPNFTENGCVSFRLTFSDCQTTKTWQMKLTINNYIIMFDLHLFKSSFVTSVWGRLTH